MMTKKLMILMVFMASVAAEAQINTSGYRSLAGFFRFKQRFPDSQLRTAPGLRLLPALNRPSPAYWEGSSYTSYSENGRIRSTHSFDVQGQLRETRTSVSLRKSGLLSSWRIQFSSARTHPLFVFTIR